MSEEKKGDWFVGKMGLRLWGFRSFIVARGVIFVAEQFSTFDWTHTQAFISNFLNG